MNVGDMSPGKDREAAVNEVVINGFGRFGLHLMRYFLENMETSNFTIVHVNDERLSVPEMIELMFHDPDVHFPLQEELTAVDVHEKRGTVSVGETTIGLTNMPFAELELKDRLVAECSGLRTDVLAYESGYANKTLISATSDNADQTLIMGFNENLVDVRSQFISYGSCTVNAFVPLAQRINEVLRVTSADVNVIHNVPRYRLDLEPRIFERRECTLSRMGPKLLGFLDESNFNVNYTLIPYPGVSRIDFRFQCVAAPDFGDILDAITAARTSEGTPLYAIWDQDHGPLAAKLNPASAIILLPQSVVRGKDVFLSAYFDNENSATRFFDAMNFLVARGWNG